MNSNFEVFAFVDGAVSPNPGKGGVGVVLVLKRGDELLVREEGIPMKGTVTNQQAEIQCILEALDLLEEPHRHRVDMTMIVDSQFTHNILTGDWNAHSYQIEWRKVRGRIALLNSFKILWKPRNTLTFMKRADTYAKGASRTRKHMSRRWITMVSEWSSDFEQLEPGEEEVAG